MYSYPQRLVLHSHRPVPVEQRLNTVEQQPSIPLLCEIPSDSTKATLGDIRGHSGVPQRMACPRAWRPLRYCVPSTLATRTYGSCQRAIPAGKQLTTDRRYAWSCYCASNYAPTSSSALQTDTHTFEVSTQSAAGKLRLDNFLVQSLADTTRARLQALIKGGLVSVNGQTCSKVALRVRPGDQVTVTLLPPPPLNAEPEAIPLDIVYEDEEVLVINKVGSL